MADPATELFRAAQKIITLERSSGFQPLLIFTLIVAGVSSAIIGWAPAYSLFAIITLGITFVMFLAVYGVKSFFDPSFCRSEKHVETLRRLDIELGQKGKPFIPEESTPGLPAPDTTTRLLEPPKSERKPE